jgi:excisionase family DNA binding protein
MLMTAVSTKPSLDELITLQEAAKLSGLSAGYLRLLLSRGDIWGMKLGRKVLAGRLVRLAQLE